MPNEALQTGHATEGVWLPAAPAPGYVTGWDFTVEDGGQAIKGPGHRTKFDVRRVWECPACRKCVRTGGHVVNLRCDCRKADGAGPAVWMKLVEGPPPPREQLGTVRQQAPPAGEPGAG